MGRRCARIDDHAGPLRARLLAALRAERAAGGGGEKASARQYLLTLSCGPICAILTRLLDRAQAGTRPAPDPRAPILNTRGAACRLGGADEPSCCSCERRQDGYDGAMPKVRHDHDSGRYHAPPDFSPDGKAHVPLCQVQSDQDLYAVGPIGRRCRRLRARVLPQSAPTVEADIGQWPIRGMPLVGGIE